MFTDAQTSSLQSAGASSHVGAQNPNAPVVPGIPPAIPDYTLFSCVGRGSYGEVWLGRNVFGEYRAVKVIYRRGYQEVRTDLALASQPTGGAARRQER
jgi:hypothetical protein